MENNDLKLVGDDEDISILLKKDDVALIIRNVYSKECGIDLVLPKTDPVSPYVALIVSLAKRIHDQEWVNEQLNFLSKEIEAMEEQNNK